MTVKDLIDRLSKFTPDTRVRTKDPGCGCCAYEDEDVDSARVIEGRHFAMNAKSGKYEFGDPMKYLLLT